MPPTRCRHGAPCPVRCPFSCPVRCTFSLGSSVHTHTFPSSLKLGASRDAPPPQNHPSKMIPLLRHPENSEGKLTGYCWAAACLQGLISPDFPVGLLSLWILQHPQGVLLLRLWSAMNTFHVWGGLYNFCPHPRPQSQRLFGSDPLNSLLSPPQKKASRLTKQRVYQISVSWVGR